MATHSNPTGAFRHQPKHPGVKLIGMELAEKVTSAARLAEKEEEVDESGE